MNFVFTPKCILQTIFGFQVFFGFHFSLQAAFLNRPELVKYNFANANICEKSPVELKFDHQDFNPGNVFTVEISPDGSFSTGNIYTMVGSLTQAGNVNNVIFTVNFPASIPYTSGYRLRIKGSDPVTYSNELNQYPFSVSKFETSDQNFSTEGYWRGSFYSWTPSITGTITNANTEDIFNPANYLGYLTEDTLSFDYNWGNSGFAPGNLADTTKVCGAYRDFFSLRMRRKINFEDGYYIFGGGADDGFRLSTDGGATWLIEDWNDHGYRGSIQNGGCGVLMTAGLRDVVVEFYENRTDARFRVIIKKTGDPSVSPVSITNLLDGAVICSQSAPIQLIGNPVGGFQFTGPGVQSNGIFNPQIGGTGSRNIVYQTGFAAFGQNCVKLTSVTVNVVPGPSAEFTLQSSFCASDTAKDLLPLTSGGVFSGPGIIGTKFSPILAGPGSHIIKHVVSSGSCVDSIEKTITVVAPSNPVISNLPASICKNLDPFKLTALPAGGTFSGTGISADTLTPGNLPLGNDSIFYTITNGPCVNIDTAIINVVAPVSAQFSGLQPTICRNSNPVTLIPQNPGGVFSGPGITGTSFSPTVAGAGVHIIKHILSTGTCADTVEKTINVIAPSIPVISNLPASVCKNQVPIVLTALPAGGIFSGVGITGNTFSPNNLPAGNDTVLYTVNSGPCVSIDTAVVNVVAPVSAQFSGIQSFICGNANPVTLIPQNPGGVFSGPGIVGNVFNPQVVAPGFNSIEHIIITQGVCFDTARFQVEVSAIPVPVLVVPDSVCISANPVLLNSNVFGSFSGQGINGNAFNPALANVGFNLITFTSVGPCSISTTDSIKVLALPDPGFNDLPDTISFSSPDIDLIPVTPGGTFEGLGVIQQNKFSPAGLIPSNTYLIKYTVTKNNCSASSEQFVYISESVLTSLVITRPDFCVNPSKKSKISFSPSGGLFSGSGLVSGDSLSAAGLSPGQYTLTYKVVLGNSSDSSEAIFTVLPPPDAGFKALPDTICEGSANVDLIANLPTGRFEGQGVTQDRKQFSPQGLFVDNNYFIDNVVTDASGCTNRSRDFIYIKSREKPVITFVQTKDKFCTYDPVLNLTTIPSSILYLNGAPVSEIDPAKLIPGEYAIQAIYTPAPPNKRCEDSASAIFRFTVINQPKPDLGPDFELEKGMALNLKPNSSDQYTWKVVPAFGELIELSKPLTFVPTVDVEVTVMAFETTGTCFGSDAVKVTLRDAPFFPTLITPNNDGDNDIWEIQNGYSGMTVHIFNRWGQEIYSGKTIGTFAWNGEEAKEAGLYFYTVTKPDDGRKWNGWIMIAK